MKKLGIFIALISLLLTSCSPTYQQFYNSHKNDINSTAFQMPRFLVHILGGLSPEANSFFKNMTDFSYITLKNVNPTDWQNINTEINSITNKKYTDILRKTEVDKKIIVSAKEANGIVQELIYFKYQNNNVNSFYLKGNFDSKKIEQLVENNEFENLSSKLLEYQN